MKYCPKCKTEYEDWVELCVDCKIMLVNQDPVKVIYNMQKMHKKQKEEIIKKKRSIGVTIISRFEIVYGSLILILGLFCIVKAFIVTPSPQYPSYQGLWLIPGLMYLFYGSIVLMVGGFTFKLKPLGRVLNLVFFSILLIIQIILVLGGIVSSHAFPMASTIVSNIVVGPLGLLYFPLRIPFIIRQIMSIIPIYFLYFFTRPKVREQFKQP